MKTKNQQAAGTALPISQQMQELEKGGKPTYRIYTPAGLFALSQGVFIKVVYGYITDVGTPSLSLWKKQTQAEQEIRLQKDNAHAYNLLGKSYKQIHGAEDREIHPSTIIIGSQWVIAYNLGEPLGAN